MYTGLFMPTGNPPKNIYQNGERAQDLDTFLSNQNTATMYMWRILNLAMSVFKWEGLPKGVDSRMLEFWLLRDGFCGFFYDEDLKLDEKNRAPEGYAVLPMLITGNWDIYEYPTDRRAYAVNGFNYECDESNSVLIFNNYLRVPMWNTMWQFAYRLSECQRTIDINMRQQRTGRLILCDEKEKLTMKNFTKEIDEGKPWIHAYKNFDLNNFQSFDITTPYVANEVQVYKNKLWNEMLTYLGIENVNTDKKERMVSDEVINNMGDVEAERFTRLLSRQQAADEINELFGLDVSVEFRSGQYIRTANTGNSRVAVTEMSEKETGNESYE